MPVGVGARQFQAMERSCLISAWGGSLGSCGVTFTPALVAGAPSTASDTLHTRMIVRICSLHPHFDSRLYL